jgi:hypothetical protein
MNLREWLLYTRHQRNPGTIFLQLHIARALRRKRQSNSQVQRRATVSLFGQVEVTSGPCEGSGAREVDQCTARGTDASTGTARSRRMTSH